MIPNMRSLGIMVIVLFCLSMVLACGQQPGEVAQQAPFIQQEIPTVSTLSWTLYTDANAQGFYIYWRDQSDAQSTYTMNNRVQVVGTSLVTDDIAAILPTVHPEYVCFVMTAYNSENKESVFSNEACGFVGTSPANGQT